MDVIQQFFEAVKWTDILFSGLRILLILILIWIATISIKIALRRLEIKLIIRGEESGDVPSEASKRAETLVRLLRQAIIILLWAIGLLIVLRELGIEIGPILASAGVIGLAIGFGAQNLVRDVIAGFFLILENQVRVGDVAIVNGTGGLVEEVNFRTIILRDLSGIVHVFPNGTINTLSNLTRDWSAYVFNIGIAYKEDTDHVIEIMHRVGTEMREDQKFGQLMIEDVEIFGVDDFADSAVMIKGRLRTRPIKQWEVGREYRRRLKKAFDAEGIEIPFPHRTLYIGDKTIQDLSRLYQSGKQSD